MSACWVIRMAAWYAVVGRLQTVMSRFLDVMVATVWHQGALLPWGPSRSYVAALGMVPRLPHLVCRRNAVRACAARRQTPRVTCHVSQVQYLYFTSDINRLAKGGNFAEGLQGRVMHECMSNARGLFKWMIMTDMVGCGRVRNWRRGREWVGAGLVRGRVWRAAVIG